MGNFIDYLVEGSNTNTLIVYCIAYFSVTLTIIVLGYITNQQDTYLKTQMGFAFNRDVLSHIQSLPISYIEKQDVAALNQRISQDTNSLISFCIDSFECIIVSIFKLLLSFLFIYLFNPMIAFIVILFIFVYYCVYRLLRNKLYTSSLILKQSQAEYFGKLHAQLSQLKQLKLNAIIHEYILRLDTPFKHMLNSILQYQKVFYIYYGLDNLILTLANIFLFIFGGQQVIHGKLSIGEFTILSTYFGVMINSARYFFTLGKNIQDNLVSYKRLKDIFSLSPNIQGEIKLNFISNIRLNDFSIYFDEKCILNHISLFFEKGNIYSIIGSNGSGKSTLVNSLLGLYPEKSKGKLLYNDVPIDLLNMDHVFSTLFGILEQEPQLFQETLEYNITLGNPELSNIPLNDYFELLNLKDFISELPSGLKTLISDKATNISGGEKQKICLLRIILKNPEVFILDEPTSALDISTANNLKDYLYSIKKDKIIIIVTHNQSFIDIADKVIRLNSF